MNRLLTLTLLVVLALDLCAPRAHAYLDPGVGSQVLQMTLAGALGLVFALKSSVQRAVSVIRSRQRK